MLGENLRQGPVFRGVGHLEPVLRVAAAVPAGLHLVEVADMVRVGVLLTVVPEGLGLDVAALGRAQGELKQVGRLVADRDPGETGADLGQRHGLLFPGLRVDPLQGHAGLLLREARQLGGQRGRRLADATGHAPALAGQAVDLGPKIDLAQGENVPALELFQARADALDEVVVPVVEAVDELLVGGVELHVARVFHDHPGLRHRGLGAPEVRGRVETVEGRAGGPGRAVDHHARHDHPGGRVFVAGAEQERHVGELAGDHALEFGGRRIEHRLGEPADRARRETAGDPVTRPLEAAGDRLEGTGLLARAHDNGEDAGLRATAEGVDHACGDHAAEEGRVVEHLARPGDRAGRKLERLGGLLAGKRRDGGGGALGGRGLEDPGGDLTAPAHRQALGAGDHHRRIREGGVRDQLNGLRVGLAGGPADNGALLDADLGEGDREVVVEPSIRKLATVRVVQDPVLRVRLGRADEDLVDHPIGQGAEDVGAPDRTQLDASDHVFSGRRRIGERHRLGRHQVVGLDRSARLVELGENGLEERLAHAGRRRGELAEGVADGVDRLVAGVEFFDRDLLRGLDVVRAVVGVEEVARGPAFAVRDLVLGEVGVGRLAGDVVLRGPLDELVAGRLVQVLVRGVVGDEPLEARGRGGLGRVRDKPLEVDGGLGLLCVRDERAQVERARVGRGSGGRGVGVGHRGWQ